MALDGFITIDSTTPSESGLYVVGLPGVTVAQLDGLTKDEQADNEETFEYIYALAQTNLKIDVQRALAQRFHIDKKLASRETSKFLDDANESTGLSGVTIELDLPRYARHQIAHLSVYQLSPNFHYKPVTGGTVYTALNYGDGIFLRGRGNTTSGIETSTDGLSWTVRTTPNLGTIIGGIAYGNDIYVAVYQTAGTSTTAVMTSPDGVTWTTRTTPSTTFGFKGIVFGDDLFVILRSSGSGAHHVSTSEDGITWSDLITIPDPDSSTWGKIIYGDGKYIIINTSSGTDYLISEDGENWYHAENMGDFTDDPTGIAYGDGAFIVCGDQGNLARSTDGEVWEVISSDIADEFGWETIGYGGGVFIAGYFGPAPDFNPLVAVSKDGRSWSAAGIPYVGISNAAPPVFAVDRFVSVNALAAGASTQPHAVLVFKETPVYIYEDDGDGDLLAEYSIDALEIGQKTVAVNSYFQADKIFVAFNPNGNFRKSENKYYADGRYKDLSCTLPCFGGTVGVTQVNDGGLNVVFNSSCSLQKVIEENINLFQHALWYRIGVDLMKERIVSDRVSRFTTLTPERATELMAVFNEDYKSALEAATMNLKFNEDTICFICKRPIVAKTSLP